MVLEKIAECLYQGQAEQVTALVAQALAAGTSPTTILNEGLLVGMNQVGRDFKSSVLFIPEVLVAARAMHAGMKVIQPLLSQSQNESRGRLMIGTVKGDLHDIGKNLVGMLMEGAGIQVSDLGTDISSEQFVNQIRAEKPQILALSALLTTTMPRMKETIQALERAGLRNQVKVMVGGAPTTQGFADDIGADGYAPDAVSAVELAKTWLDSAH